MTPPQLDVLRPSPLDLGGVITGAVKTLRQRLGQFAVLALIPSALMFVLLTGAMVPFVMGIVTAVAQQRFSALIVLGLVLMFAALVIGYLAQIKIQAMITLGAVDVIHRHPSTAGDLSRRTAGVVGRVLLLVPLVIAAVFIGYGLIVGVGVALVLGAVTSLEVSGSSDPGTAVGLLVGAVVLMSVLIAALSFLMFYLAVRFLYFMPALAVENLPALAALKRSWQLTRGNVLRTFGYYIVATLVVSLASYVVSLIGQLMWLPAVSAPASAYEFDPTTQLLAVLPGIVVTALLSFALQVLALPFLTCYVAVMYIDQLRRTQRAAAFPPPAQSVPAVSYPPPPPPAPGAGPGQWRPVNPPPQQGWSQQPPWGPPPTGGA